VSDLSRRDALIFLAGLPFFKSASHLNMTCYRKSLDSSIIYRCDVQGTFEQKKLFLKYFHDKRHPGWNVEIEETQEIRWEFTGYHSIWNGWIEPRWKSEMSFYVAESEDFKDILYAFKMVKKCGIKVIVDDHYIRYGEISV
jgi:hypothetical protein